MAIGRVGGCVEALYDGVAVMGWMLVAVTLEAFLPATNSGINGRIYDRLSMYQGSKKAICTRSGLVREH